ncbi:SRPBCC family protein [Parahaliea mediterranea]|uniref:SRPBCC family protein n=1 Tax=Parahaliea mediterranea TaxID=651086 RepID=A0A939INJ1_9GAMM|nr:SRPBCC family protein [Parahaliea mediterranea]
MHTFTVEKTLEAPLDKVWAVVSDFANLDWFGGAERVEAVGEGVGQVRRIFMPGMDAPVEEKLLARDAQRHCVEYAVLEGGMNVMRDYRVAASLSDNGAGGTLARWEAAFSGVSVEGVDPQDMIDVMQGTYDGMLDAIAIEALKR